MTGKDRIAVLTGGGDCPGTNAVIRAVAKKAILEYGMEIVGIEDGFEGLINEKYRRLEYNDVSGIITLGGTILGTSNTANPYRYAVKSGTGDKIKFKDVSVTVISNLKKLGVECLVCIGGDGTLNIASKLAKSGIPVVGIPKTIDNDLHGTDITFGFDTAVSIATEGIDRIHTTAQSHHRVMIIEVMGRDAGWIALYAGIAGGGDIILIPEIPYSMDIIAEKVLQRSKRGKRFTIVVVAEGAKPRDGSSVVQRIVKESTEPLRLGGVGFVLGTQIEQATGLETRTVVMGHLLRGGTPTPFDRVLATRLGASTIDMIAHKKYGCMVGVRGDTLAEVPLEDITKGKRTVSPNNPLIGSARSVGTCFGD